MIDLKLFLFKILSIILHQKNQDPPKNWNLQVLRRIIIPFIADWKEDFYKKYTDVYKGRKKITKRAKIVKKLIKKSQQESKVNKENRDQRPKKGSVSTDDIDENLRSITKISSGSHNGISGNSNTPNKRNLSLNLSADASKVKNNKNRLSSTIYEEDECYKAEIPKKMEMMTVMAMERMSPKKATTNKNNYYSVPLNKNKSVQEDIFVEIEETIYEDVITHEPLDINYITEFFDEFIQFYVKIIGSSKEFPAIKVWFDKILFDLETHICLELDKILKDGHSLLVLQDEFKYDYDDDQIDTQMFDQIMKVIYIASNYNIEKFVSHKVIQSILKNHGMNTLWQDRWYAFWSIIIFLFYPLVYWSSLLRPHLNHPTVNQLLPIWGMTLCIPAFIYHLYYSITVELHELDDFHQVGSVLSGLEEIESNFTTVATVTMPQTSSNLTTENTTSSTTKSIDFTPDNVISDYAKSCSSRGRDYAGTYNSWDPHLHWVELGLFLWWFSFTIQELLQFLTWSSLVNDPFENFKISDEIKLQKIDKIDENDTKEQAKDKLIKAKYELDQKEIFQSQRNRDGAVNVRDPEQNTATVGRKVGKLLQKQNSTKTNNENSTNFAINSTTFSVNHTNNTNTNNHEKSAESQNLTVKRLPRNFDNLNTLGPCDSQDLLKQINEHRQKQKTIRNSITSSAEDLGNPNPTKTNKNTAVKQKIRKMSVSANVSPSPSTKNCNRNLYGLGLLEKDYSNQASQMKKGNHNRLQVPKQNYALNQNPNNILLEEFEKETMNKLRQPLPGYDYTRSLTRHSLGIHHNSYHKIRNEVANELSKSRSKDTTYNTYNNSRNTIATSLKGKNNDSNSGLTSTDGLGRVLFHHTDMSQDLSISQDKERPIKTNPVNKNKFQIKSVPKDRPSLLAESAITGKTGAVANKIPPTENEKNHENHDFQIPVNHRLHLPIEGRKNKWSLQYIIESHDPMYRNTTYFKSFWNTIDIVIVVCLFIYFVILFILKPHDICDKVLKEYYSVPWLFYTERLCLSIGNSLIILRMLENIANVIPDFGFFVAGFMRIFYVIPIFLIMIIIISATTTYLVSGFLCSTPSVKLPSPECVETKWHKNLLQKFEVQSQDNKTVSIDLMHECSVRILVDIILLPFGNAIHRGKSPLTEIEAMSCYDGFTQVLMICIKLLFYLTTGFALLRGAMLKYLLGSENEEHNRTAVVRTKAYVRNAFSDISHPVPWNLMAHLWTCFKYLKRKLTCSKRDPRKKGYIYKPLSTSFDVLDTVDSTPKPNEDSGCQKNKPANAKNLEALFKTSNTNSANVNDLSHINNYKSNSQFDDKMPLTTADEKSSSAAPKMTRNIQLVTLQNKLAQANPKVIIEMPSDQENVGENRQIKVAQKQKQQQQQRQVTKGSKDVISVKTEQDSKPKQIGRFTTTQVSVCKSEKDNTSNNSVFLQLTESQELEKDVTRKDDRSETGSLLTD